MFLNKLASVFLLLGSNNKEAENKRRKLRRFRPRLEQLEGRLVPATVNNWTDNMGDHLWSTNGNWSQTHVPTQNEIPTFTAAHITNVTLNANATVYGLDVQAGYTGKINLNATLEVTTTMNQADPNSEIAGGVLQFDGQVNGTFNWTGGTRSGTDPVRQGTIIQPAANVVIGTGNAGNEVTLDDRVGAP